MYEMAGGGVSSFREVAPSGSSTVTRALVDSCLAEAFILKTGRTTGNCRPESQAGVGRGWGAAGADVKRLPRVSRRSSYDDGSGVSAAAGGDFVQVIALSGSMNTTPENPLSSGRQAAGEDGPKRNRWPDDGAGRESLSMPPALDCWYLTGPTAAGKTSVGIEMARQLNADIISLDSMAVYRGMDIGTAKPTPEQLRQIPHHLIDVLEPTQEFSVSNYVEAAHTLIRQIRRQGREVLFVGGTPMYLKAMLRGIYQGPPADWDFRTQVEAEARRVGIEALHERLRQVDPLSAEKLHQNDVRRIIRALEVYKITGEPISHQQLQFDEGTPALRCRVFCLGWARASLHERIDARVKWMFDAGLVDEVRGLLQRYGQLGRTASQAVGYRESIELLRGRCLWSEAMRRVQVRTHQFARRQETWFRSLSECRRVELDETGDPRQVAARLVEAGMGVR